MLPIYRGFPGLPPPPPLCSDCGRPQTIIEEATIMTTSSLDFLPLSPFAIVAKETTVTGTQTVAPKGDEQPHKQSWRKRWGFGPSPFHMSLEELEAVPYKATKTTMKRMTTSSCEAAFLSATTQHTLTIGHQEEKSFNLFPPAPSCQKLLPLKIILNCCIYHRGEFFWNRKMTFGAILMRCFIPSQCLN